MFCCTELTEPVLFFSSAAHLPAKDNLLASAGNCLTATSAQAPASYATPGIAKVEPIVPPAINAFSNRLSNSTASNTLSLPATAAIYAVSSCAPSVIDSLAKPLADCATKALNTLRDFNCALATSAADPTNFATSTLVSFAKVCSATAFPTPEAIIFLIAASLVAFLRMLPPINP